jgi:hypothetical protein
MKYRSKSGSGKSFLKMSIGLVAGSKASSLDAIPTARGTAAISGSGLTG